MRPVHTDRSENYQQNEVAGKPNSGSGLKNLGWLNHLITEFSCGVRRLRNQSTNSFAPQLHPTTA